MQRGNPQQDFGKESQRAEVLSAAVRANMRRRKYLPIAYAMQPVAACAWAVVDGLAGEADLHAEALVALEKIKLQSGALPERNLLAKVAEDTWECMQEEAAAEAPAAEGISNEHVPAQAKGVA